MTSFKEPLRVGNAQGFWGDSSLAPSHLANQAPDLDYLTLDYLAEVSMSILARQRERDPSAGYARDFIEVIESLAPVWRGGKHLRVVTNAGGLSPANCGLACAEALRRAGCGGLKIAVVSGDDVLPMLRAALAADHDTAAFSHLETGERLASVAGSLVTANAYVGAAPIAEALSAGADVVITGRVADPSLTVGPCLAHFGWQASDYDRIAGATIAGHLIECGAQVTGGISTDWLTLNDPAHIGYPIAEISADGSCVVTKPPGTGGRVDERIVKEQLLYEIGDPANYLSPDATVSFLGLSVTQDGADRVRVRGAAGGPPPPSYKVSATYRAGYRAAGTLTVTGRDALAKARRCGEVVLQRLTDAGSKPGHYLAECLGAGDVVIGAAPAQGCDLTEIVLRVAAADPRREVVERFTRELSPLITTGPQGITGYAEGRPAVREVFGYWPTLIERERVMTEWRVLDT
jgi:hypothetical protein